MWVQNPKAPLKPECYKCGYLNSMLRTFYKCRVPGSCPAVSIPKEKES